MTMPEKISPAILEWYDNNARALVWRAKPGSKTPPYLVWLSEIMLQQTTVVTVKSYFEKFTRLWPNVHALAGAELDEVLSAWAGLGYYARARNLHACAQIVSREHGGTFPGQVRELLTLPGIGPYTAAAIAAIAFDEPVAAIDGNVERVISRLYAITAPLPDSKAEIRRRAGALVPQARAGDFAQALMDLGAMVCTPRNPSCRLCPLAQHCAAKAKGLEQSLPTRKPRPAKPTRYGRAFVVQREDGAVLLRRRPAKGLLGGMLEVPSTPWREDLPVSGNVIKHTFTHFHLVLAVERNSHCHEAEMRDESSHEWVRPDDLAGKALPTVMKKVLVYALGPDIF